MSASLLRSIIRAGLLFGLGAVLLAGCGTPRERYRTLSFFFDGVPNPDAVKTVALGNAAPVPVSVRHVQQHVPYRDNMCDACHRGSNGELQDFSEAYKQCLKCHKTVPSAHVLMHGPVARGACSWCHTPHESAEPALLKNAPIIVCTQCHNRELLGPTPPEHLDGATSCLQCHFGHGGDARYFLKPEARPAGAPAGNPTALPAPPPPTSPTTTAPALPDAPATRPDKEPSP